MAQRKKRYLAADTPYLLVETFSVRYGLFKRFFNNKKDIEFHQTDPLGLCLYLYSAML